MAGDVERPLLDEERPQSFHQGYSHVVVANGAGCGHSSGITSVLAFSGAVVLCGSFNFGCAMGYSSPEESGIMDDMGLSLAEYSLFTSILTLGATISGVISGRTTDFLGPRGVKSYDPSVSSKPIVCLGCRKL